MDIRNFFTKKVANAGESSVQKPAESGLIAEQSSSSKHTSGGSLNVSSAAHELTALPSRQATVSSIPASPVNQFDPGNSNNKNISCATAFIIPDKPFHPNDLSLIPTQLRKSQKANFTLKFQKNWFDKFPWLHFEPSVGGVLCHICASASHQGILNLAKNSETSFISKGYNNWKKAIQNFESHQKSKCHELASSNLMIISTNKTVNTLLDKKCSKDQSDARDMLIKMITSLRFLAERGLAIRGHTTDNANFTSLLMLRSEDDERIKQWLSRSRLKYTSGEIQNELIHIMACEVRSLLCTQIQNNKFFEKWLQVFSRFFQNC